MSILTGHQALDCPICHADLPADAATESPLFPFCSLRCKQVDLLRWTEGKYAIEEPLTLERLLAEAGANLMEDLAEPESLR